jgi:8-oxo-dGTP diphosphatase
LEEAGARIAEAALGATPALLEQVGAFADARRHPGDADVSVGLVALTPHVEAALVAGAEWFSLAALPPLSPRHRAIVDRATVVVRQRVDQSPLAFRLLPPTFTLSELQAIYELLLGRRLHKASFRRALQASYLVEPTDEWRSEGRGRPAQLFQYAPRRRRGARRGVRFDLFTDG